MTESLKKLMECLIKVETFFNQVLFKNLRRSNTGIGNSFSMIPDSTRDLNMSERSSKQVENSENIQENSQNTHITVSNEILNIESYRSAQLSDIIKEMNIGYLIPLKCGHNGVFSQAEIDMYSLFLLNSKFIT